MTSVKKNWFCEPELSSAYQRITTWDSMPKTMDRTTTSLPPAPSHTPILSVRNMQLPAAGSKTDASVRRTNHSSPATKKDQQDDNVDEYSNHRRRDDYDDGDHRRRHGRFLPYDSSLALSAPNNTHLEHKTLPQLQQRPVPPAPTQHIRGYQDLPPQGHGRFSHPESDWEDRDRTRPAETYRRSQSHYYYPREQSNAHTNTNTTSSRGDFSFVSLMMMMMIDGLTF